MTTCAFTLEASPPDPQPEIRHVRCPLCGWPLEVTADVYPHHSMINYKPGSTTRVQCPRSGTPFDASAPAMAIPLPWDR